jgi:hypothetical protein
MSHVPAAGAHGFVEECPYFRSETGRREHDRRQIGRVNCVNDTLRSFRVKSQWLVHQEVPSGACCPYR